MDLVIISYNTKEITARSIGTALEHNPNINIVLVDNASTDGSIEFLGKAFPSIDIIANKKNLGYARAVNIGVSKCNSEFVLVANSDVYYYKDSIRKLEETLLADSTIAICGPQQIYPDDRWQYSFGYLPGIKLGFMELFFLTGLRRFLFKKKWQQKTIKGFEPEYLDGAALALNKKVFVELGGFDENFFFYTEEADYCKRVKDAGYRIYFQPDSEVIHLRGGSSGHFSIDAEKSEKFIKSKILYCNKHLSAVEKKIYYYCEILANFNKYLVWSFLNLFLDNKTIKTKKNWFRTNFKTWKKLTHE